MRGAQARQNVLTEQHPNLRQGPCHGVARVLSTAAGAYDPTVGRDASSLRGGGDERWDSIAAAEYGEGYPAQVRADQRLVRSLSC